MMATTINTVLLILSSASLSRLDRITDSRNIIMMNASMNVLGREQRRAQQVKLHCCYWWAGDFHICTMSLNILQR